MAHASFYCGAFAKNDVRIEQTLKAVEAVVRRRLTHYAHTGFGTPKAMPGDRVSFVSRWLPGVNEKFDSESLCPRDITGSWVLVNLDNIRTLPGLLSKRGAPFSGAVNISYLESSPMRKRVVTGFADLVVGTGCFHARLTSFPLLLQRNRTRQRLAEELKELERFRAFSEAHWKGNYDLLMRKKDEYVYDIDAHPLTGVTPDGQAYPLELLWLNYWNDATAARLRFPDEKLDAPLKGLYERLPGGWLVKLTVEPTDLDKPADRERLQWAYDRLASGA